MTFGRHAREFARAIRAQQWERSDDGVWFPRQGALLSGQFAWRGRTQRNTITLYGLRLLATMLEGGGLAGLSQPWGHFAIFGFPLTPHERWTEADLYMAGEYGGPPDGYTAAGGRAQFDEVNEGRVIGNTASPAALTIAATTTIDVYGFALCANNTVRGGAFGTTSFDPTVIDLAPLVAPVDTPLLTALGTLRAANDSIGGRYAWFDPGGDDFFDGSTWVDPGLDDVSMATPSDLFDMLETNAAGEGDLISATLISGGPDTFSDGDPLNITYTLDLS